MPDGAAGNLPKSSGEACVSGAVVVPEHIGRGDVPACCAKGGVAERHHPLAWGLGQPDFPALNRHLRPFQPADLFLTQPGLGQEPDDPSRHLRSFSDQLIDLLSSRIGRPWW